MCAWADADGSYNSKNESHATSATDAMLTNAKPLQTGLFVIILALAMAGCATTASSPGEVFTLADESLSPVQSAPASAVASTERARSPQSSSAKPKKPAQKAKKPTGSVAANQKPGPVDEDLWQRIRQGLKLDVPDHPRLREARRWLDAHPQYLARLEENVEPFIYLVTERVERRDLPLEIALLPMIESSYNPTATSPRNAAGLWQFTPGTARAMGLQQNTWVDARRDVEASTDAALNYLQYLAQQFDGDWHLALAAYNAGEGTIRRAIDRNARAGKPTDFWSLELPAETTRYVPRLLAVSEAVAAAGRVSLPPLSNTPKLAAVEMPAQIRISTASRECNVPEDELKLYNPGLRRGATSPDGPHRILLPIDEAFACQQVLLASLPQSDRSGWSEQLASSAAASPVSPAEAGAPYAQSSSEDSIRSLGSFAARPADVPAKPAFTFAAPDADGGIVPNREQAATELKALDRLARTYRIDNLSLAPAAGRKTSKGRLLKAETRSSEAVRYRVARGDTLYSIARKHGVSVDDLKRWNKIRGERVTSGQTLSIQTSATRRL